MLARLIGVSISIECGAYKDTVGIWKVCEKKKDFLEE